MTVLSLTGCLSTVPGSVRRTCITKTCGRNPRTGNEMYNGCAGGVLLDGQVTAARGGGIAPGLAVRMRYMTSEALPLINGATFARPSSADAKENLQVFFDELTSDSNVLRLCDRLRQRGEVQGAH